MEITVNFFIDMLKAAKPIAVSKLIAIAIQHGLNAQQALQLCNQFEIELQNDLLDMSEYPLPKVNSVQQQKWFEEKQKAYSEIDLKLSAIDKSTKTQMIVLYEISVKNKSAFLLFHANQCQGFLQADRAITDLIEQLKESAN